MRSDISRPIKNRAADVRITLSLIGMGLLVLWIAFWVDSATSFTFATRHTWIPTWSFLGVDFMHPFLGVRAWVAGLDPYRTYIGDFRGRYSAPPITLALFAWTRFFNIYTATLIWLSVIALTMVYAIIACVRVRAKLGLWVPPIPLALALVLWSMPVLFSMERGNLDAWVLITLFIAMNLLRRSEGGRWYFEVLAGLVLAVGAWAKMYPALFVLAMLPFGRWKAALACFIGIVLIAVIPLDMTRLFFRNAAQLEENRVAPLQEVGAWVKHPTFERYAGKIDPKPFGHSLTSCWPFLFGKTPLGTIPGVLGAALIVGPAWLYVAWLVYRAPGREKLFLPFVLWTIALGTYGLPMSYDYNLFFLLLTVLCLWDRRDPIIVHILMLSVLIWWQPISLPIKPELFISLKLCALVPVTLLLIRRANELPRPLPETSRALADRAAA